MTLKVYGLMCGALRTYMGRRLGEVTLPVPAYLLDHPKGLAIYDTGLPQWTGTDPESAIGADMLKAFEPIVGEGDDLAARIEQAGFDPAKVDVLVNSHLHFDHCGGNHMVPNAELLVQREEWDVACDRGSTENTGFRKALFDLGHRTRKIDGEYDIFGDGSAVLIPTPGHTVAHQSLRLRTENGEVALAADCCYFHSTLDDEKIPRGSYNADEHIRSLRKLRALRDRGTKIVCGHDNTDWADAKNGILRIA